MSGTTLYQPELFDPIIPFIMDFSFSPATMTAEIVIRAPKMLTIDFDEVQKYISGEISISYNEGPYPVVYLSGTIEGELCSYIYNKMRQ